MEKSSKSFFDLGYSEVEIIKDLIEKDWILIRRI